MRKISGFSALEVILVMIIVGVLSSLAIIGYSKQARIGMEKKAKLTLEITLAAEKDFYAYQGRYTNDWEKLQIEKPVDPKYDYRITKATHDDVEIEAVSKSTEKSFVINTEGKISEI